MAKAKKRFDHHSAPQIIDDFIEHFHLLSSAWLLTDWNSHRGWFQSQATPHFQRYCGLMTGFVKAATQTKVIDYTAASTAWHNGYKAILEITGAIPFVKSHHVADHADGIRRERFPGQDANAISESNLHSAVQIHNMTVYRGPHDVAVAARDVLEMMTLQIDANKPSESRSPAERERDAIAALLS